jgi:hypothetical protein
MATTTRRRLTDEERAQRRAQDRERFEQAARQLLSSDGWRRWIEIRSRNGLARYCLVISGRRCRRPLVAGRRCRRHVVDAASLVEGTRRSFSGM